MKNFNFDKITKTSLAILKKNYFFLKTQILANLKNAYYFILKFWVFFFDKYLIFTVNFFFG